MTVAPGGSYSLVSQHLASTVCEHFCFNLPTDLGHPAASALGKQMLGPVFTLEITSLDFIVAACSETSVL